MPLTALFLLPFPPTAPSPTPSLTSHITLTFDCASLSDPPTPYTLSHHLFASTSSLLPNKASTRQYTQLLTLAHSSSTTFVGTTLPSQSTSQVTIPSSSTESFLALLHSKLQPHWSPRQSLVVSDGAALLLKTPLGAVELRIGDLRTVAGRAGPPNAFKGVLLEVTQLNTDGNIGTEVKDSEKGLLRALLERLLSGTSVKLGGEGAKELFRYTENREETSTPDGEESNKKTDWALSEMYMELLRAKS